MSGTYRSSFHYTSMLFTLLLWSMVCIVSTTGCYHNVFLRTRTNNEIIQFKLNYLNVHGMYRITVWDNSNAHFIWVIKAPGYVKIPNLRYGVVPASMNQTYPPNNEKPRKLTPGETVVVCITYSYDYLAGPTSVDKTYLFFVKPDGGLERVKDQQVKWPATLEPVTINNQF